jgi:hypothetical protein
VDSAISERDAYGRWQITYPVYLDFITFNKRRIYISWEEVKEKPSINDLVGYWQWQRLLKQFGGHKIKSLNSFNMGSRNTQRGKYYESYCSRIIGQDYWKWRSNYICTNVVKEVRHLVHKDIYSRLNNIKE